MPLSAKLSILLSGITQTKVVDGDNVTFSPALTHTKSMVDGVGAGQADILWRDLARSLAASATEDLDLRGVLTNVFGDLVNLVKVKVIVVKAASGNTNDVVVGGAATNAFPLFSDVTDKIPVKPGGCLAIDGGDAGYAVTAGTGDLLRIGNGGAGSSVTYDIWLIGTSA